MGMFDSLYDKTGREWQTKAFDCELNEYRIGESLPVEGASFQVEVCGGRRETFTETHATIRDGVLAEVPADRDASLPLLNYSGRLVPTPTPGHLAGTNRTEEDERG